MSHHTPAEARGHRPTSRNARMEGTSVGRVGQLRMRHGSAHADTREARKHAYSRLVRTLHFAHRMKPSTSILGILACIAFVACSSSDGSNAASDAGSDGTTNPCEGLGCASSPGTLILRVLDSRTTTPVASPSFSEAGHPIVGECAGGSDAGTDASSDASSDVGDAGDAGAVACSDWRFTSLAEGAHTIQIDAPGFQTATVE